jgi:hypothetical protein
MVKHYVKSQWHEQLKSKRIATGALHWLIWCQGCRFQPSRLVLNTGGLGLCCSGETDCLISFLYVRICIFVVSHTGLIHGLQSLASTCLSRGSHGWEVAHFGEVTSQLLVVAWFHLERSYHGWIFLWERQQNHEQSLPTFPTLPTPILTTIGKRYLFLIFLHLYFKIRASV